jgi:hypothetical protein
VHHSSEDILKLMVGTQALSEELWLPVPGELNRDEVFIMQPSGTPTAYFHQLRSQNNIHRDQVITST